MKRFCAVTGLLLFLCSCSFSEPSAPVATGPVTNSVTTSVVVAAPSINHSTVSSELQTNTTSDETTTSHSDRMEEIHPEVVATYFSDNPMVRKIEVLRDEIGSVVISFYDFDWRGLPLIEKSNLARDALEGCSDIFDYHRYELGTYLGVMENGEWLFSPNASGGIILWNEGVDNGEQSPLRKWRAFMKRKRTFYML